jgi:hypothetical protein
VNVVYNEKTQQITNHISKSYQNHKGNDMQNPPQCLTVVASCCVFTVFFPPSIFDYTGFRFLPMSRILCFFFSMGTVEGPSGLPFGTVLRI